MEGSRYRGIKAFNLNSKKAFPIKILIESSAFCSSFQVACLICHFA